MEHEEDDDGFIGYVPTSIDPGYWVLVGTVLFCVISNLMLPCMVALGRRYEKRRLDQKTPGEINVSIDDHADEAMSKQGVEVAAGVLPTPSENAPSSSQAPSSYVRSNHNSSHHGTGTKENPVKNMVDKIIMPPYPDDDGSSLAMPRRVGYTQSEQSVSGRSVRSLRTMTSSLMNGSVSFLDTGGGRRNRHAGKLRYQRALMGTRWRNEQEAERRKSEVYHQMMGASIDVPGYEDTHSYTPGGGDGSVRESDSIRSYTTARTNVSAPVNYSKSARAHAYRRRRQPSDMSLMSQLEDNAVSPNDAVDAGDPGAITALNERATMAGDGNTDLCCGEHACWKPSSVSSGFDRIVEVAEWNRETKRITALAVPFSLAALLEGVFDSIRVGLVAHYLGTDAVAAYTIVDLIIGLADEFFGGLALTAATLCSHAIGAKNHFLAGQYVQISCILFSVCMIPNIIVWFFFTDDVVRLFGFNENTAQLAQDFARFFIFEELFGGLYEAYGSFLEVIGHEIFSTAVSIADNGIGTCIIAALLIKKDIELRDVGLVSMVITIAFFGFMVAFSVWVGWVDKYTKGMFRNFALRNKAAVKTVLRTATPLALGQVLQYGEWEVLTIFVAALGPAEVVAWGIVGTIWDTLETLTEGFGDAGEIRVSYHLGSAYPVKARLAAYKTILISVMAATILTAVFWIIGEDLAVWFTPDPTLQRLIADLLPLVGIGNIALTAGTVSWALVGAQGRYRLATFVAFMCTWCITIPLSAIFVYALNINMQGVTGAVVVGYSVTGTTLLYILIRSDWDRLSRIVIELNAGDEMSESSSDDSEGEGEEDML